MLRPATPLSILFFIAFVLLLLSTISTPIIRGIPIATFKGVNFGVLGYCNGDKCDGPMIGYDTGMCCRALPWSTESNTLTQTISSPMVPTRIFLCRRRRDTRSLRYSSSTPWLRS